MVGWKWLALISWDEYGWLNYFWSKFWQKKKIAKTISEEQKKTNNVDQNIVQLSKIDRQILEKNIVEFKKLIGQTLEQKIF